MQIQGKATYVERIGLCLYSLLLDFSSALVRFAQVAYE